MNVYPAHDENSAPRQAGGRYSIHQATSMLEIHSSVVVLSTAGGGQEAAERERGEQGSDGVSRS